MKLHHLGFACKNIRKSVEYIKDSFDVESVSHQVHDESQNADVCLVEIRGMVSIELVSGPTVENLLNKGITLYHTCYECGDIETEINKMKSNGATLISSAKPARLFGGRRVAFLNTHLGIIELLEGNSPSVEAPPRTQKLVISASFTAEPLLKYLNLLANKIKFEIEIRLTGYGQLFQDLLNPAGLFQANGDGFNLLLMRFEDWVYHTDLSSESTIKEQVSRNLDHLIEILKKQSQLRIMVLICPPSASLTDSLKNFYQACKSHLVDSLNCFKHVCFLNFPMGLDDKNTGNYYCHHSDKIAHLPYSDGFFETLATGIMRKIQSLVGYPFKVIVLDCDNTLWDGLCGDSGYGGITLGEERLYLQRFMLRQRDAGMLLCLCSKNNEEDVLAVFQHRNDMAIKLEDLVAWQVNWKKKSENIKALAKKLNLGLDSFIFCDDNPVECAEVQLNCPEITVLNIPQDRKTIPGFLEQIWIFDHEEATEEDKNRTVLYQQNAARQNYRDQSLAFEDFIDGLELQVTFHSPSGSRLERASQLTRRTNQFNLSTRRRTVSELEKLLERGYGCQVVHVSDRFGNYGDVGVILFKKHVPSGELTVDSFLLSCRVLGRGVEHAMLSRLGKIAQEAGLKHVKLVYRNSHRNEPVLTFLKSLEFMKSTEPGDEITFSLTSEQALAVNFSDLLKAAPSGPAPFGEAKLVMGKSGGVNNRVQAILSATISPQPLLKPKTEQAPKAKPESPANGVEALCRIFKEALAVTRVGADDNFFRMGGDSLLAVNVASRVFGVFDVELTVLDIFDHPTPAGLLERIHGGLKHRNPADSEQKLAFSTYLSGVDRNRTVDGYPLSFSQEALWGFQKAHPENCGYNMPLELQIKGDLNIGAMRHGFVQLAQRHEALRTVFGDQNGTPYQRILESVAAPLVVEHLPRYDKHKIDTFLEVEEHTPIDLESGPPFRVKILKTGEHEFLLLLTIHHIVFDGWSYGVILRDLAVFYNAMVAGVPAPVKGLPARMVDFAQWQRLTVDSPETERQINYWKGALANLALHEISSDFPEPGGTGEGHYYAFEFDETVVSGLKKLSRQGKTSLFTAIVSLLDLFLYSYTGHGDVAVGSIVATRNSKALEDLVGFLVNALVLRCRLSENPNFKQILLENRETILAAFENQDLPFGMVIDAMKPKQMGRNNPFFQIYLLWQNRLSYQLELNGLQTSKYRQGYHIARGDLVLELQEEGPIIKGGFYYDTSYFKLGTIKDFARRMQFLATRLVGNPELLTEEIVAMVQAAVPRQPIKNTIKALN